METELKAVVDAFVANFSCIYHVVPSAFLRKEATFARYLWQPMVWKHASGSPDGPISDVHLLNGTSFRAFGFFSSPS